MSNFHRRKITELTFGVLALRQSDEGLKLERQPCYLFAVKFWPLLATVLILNFHWMTDWTDSNVKHGKAFAWRSNILSSRWNLSSKHMLTQPSQHLIVVRGFFSILFLSYETGFLRVTSRDHVIFEQIHSHTWRTYISTCLYFIKFILLLFYYKIFTIFLSLFMETDEP